MEHERDYDKIIDGFIYDYPVCEFYSVSPEELVFSDRVRYICEHECEHYGKSWACPPAIDTIDRCIEECRTYSRAFLFSTVAEVPDCMDFAACLDARRDHEKITRELRARFAESFGKVLALSTGCMLCESCAYPSAPCRNPEERLSTIESHGILIMETASRLGASFDCGNNIVTYFSLIFFNP